MKTLLNLALLFVLSLNLSNLVAQDCSFNANINIDGPLHVVCESDPYIEWSVNITDPYDVIDGNIEIIVWSGSYMNVPFYGVSEGSYSGYAQVDIDPTGTAYELEISVYDGVNVPGPGCGVSQVFDLDVQEDVEWTAEVISNEICEDDGASFVRLYPGSNTASIDDYELEWNNDPGAITVNESWEGGIEHYVIQHIEPGSYCLDIQYTYSPFWICDGFACFTIGVENEAIDEPIFEQIDLVDENNQGASGILTVDAPPDEISISSSIFNGTYSEPILLEDLDAGTYTLTYSNTAGCSWDYDITIPEYVCCSGCMDSTACNYDSSATIEDACLYFDECGICGGTGTIGCVDPSACNYNSGASCDDGSCILPDGCTDPSACNYVSSALCDDDSCTYPGCTDSTACNFYIDAACDDGSCIIPDGCTDSSACNYNSTAQCDDGSCILPDGCTDFTACNYDSAAQCDDGSCFLPDGCTDFTACNYDSTALCDDGSCILPDGCADVEACNYDSSASCNDASCTYPGCLDPLAINFDSTAACPGPCEYSGDIDGDGTVNIADLLLILAQIGCMGDCSADLNADGIVNVYDLLMFLAQLE